MGLFSFFKNNKALKDYETFLNQVFTSQKFDSDSLEQLKIFRAQLSQDEQIKVESASFKPFYDSLSTDRKVTTDEVKQLEALFNYLQRQPAEITTWNKDQFTMDRYRGHIFENKLPKWANVNLKINFKDEEEIIFECLASQIKKTKSLERINYSGFTYNFSIAKGFRYRLGTIKPQVNLKEALTSVDDGILWISNQRIGFKGNEKNINFELKKIESIEIENSLLKLFKTGKESPYLIFTSELDTFCAVLNLYMSGDYKAL